MYCGEKRGARIGAQAGISCAPQVVSPLSLGAVRVHRGLDFLKLSFWVDWKDQVFLELLEQKKSELQKTEAEKVAPFRYVGREWNVFRAGTQIYPFRLQQGDVTLLLNKRNSNTNFPCVRLEIGSLTSQTDLELTVIGMMSFLKDCGATIVKEQVSEVHLAADFIGLDIAGLGLENPGRWVARAREFSSHYENWEITGCSLGKGDIMLRCYDKVRELRLAEHKQEIFRKLWGVDRFDELPVTRVEYQLRRPVLKTFKGVDCRGGLSSVSVLLKSLSALWRYCTHDWARLMRSTVDRKGKNQAHAIISEFWQVVKGIVWDDALSVFRSKETKHKDISTLRKQVLGGMMSIVAFYVQDIYDFSEIKKVAQKLIDEDLSLFLKFDEDEFFKRMICKRNEAVFETIPF